jgi:hypothetical protein
MLQTYRISPSQHGMQILIVQAEMRQLMLTLKHSHAQPPRVHVLLVLRGEISHRNRPGGSEDLSEILAYRHGPLPDIKHWSLMP